jgi:OPA family glycerol-3-phosphate transporter-like MFS transporter 1/2
MVPEVSITVFCLKVVRYCMYMWLPMYLLQHLGYSKTNAGMFSTMFEIGGIAGSATVGYCLNKFFQNKALLGSTVGTFLSAIGLILFMLTSNMGIMVNSIVMILIGFLNCGPDIVLCGSFPTELGEMDGRNAASAVIGFVNGIGSIGTFIEGPIIGWISENYGWSGMFYSMVFLSFLGTVTCYRAHRIYEIKKKHLNLGNIVVNNY